MLTAEERKRGIMTPETRNLYLELVAAAQRADAAAQDELAAAIAAFPHGEKESVHLLASAKNRAVAARDLRQAVHAAHPRPCEPALPCDLHHSYQDR
jgi:hypothetical protein